jgi:hypothetical protein
MYKLEKLIIGTFAHFVEAGTEVGTEPVNTVGALFKPTFPGEPWASMGCILDATPETEVETDTDYCPNASGGYTKADDQNVVKDMLKLSLRAHSEPIHRLIWGANAKLADTTSVTPFVKTDRFVEGWLQFQGVGQDGLARFVASLYGKIRLDAAPQWAKDPTKPAIRFEIIKTALNTYVPDKINPPIPD